ncbi:MAG: argininosuccinate synthase [Dehalococcoidia bacterium]|nr:argininosuccinate synthase [Dehalococcoidia bacterium]
MPKLILAYSGGLDTTTAITWLSEERGYEVVALNINAGMSKDQDTLEERGIAAGASKVLVHDAREDFLRYFAFPALTAGAIYQSTYPLATALARPLMAKLLVETAHNENAVAVAHGCTGKGNDQVRFDIGIQTLDPELRIVAPTREESMSREAEIDYLQNKGISIEWEPKGSFSIDENIWGRSCEAGILEDPWVEPPDEAWEWTNSIDATPTEPEEIEITFEQGFPTKIGDINLDPVSLVEQLNTLGGRYGIGRADHVEDRLIGIKSRELYEAPAAVLLHTAHKALESITLSRRQLRMKQYISEEYAELIYDGHWFSRHHQDLASYVISTQRNVSGSVRLKLHRGTITITGRKSDESLYDYGLATYDRNDTFDQSSSIGFIDIWGLQTRVQAKKQLLEKTDILKIAHPPQEGAD